MSRAQASLFALCSLFATAGFAMHVRTNTTLVGFSDDGASVLLRIDERGPEGGGRTSLRLFEPDGATTEAALSDDMSPGDGTRPQRISRAQCAKSTAALLSRMAKPGFRGLKAGAQGCGLAGEGEKGRALEARLVDNQWVIFSGPAKILKLEPAALPAAIPPESVEALASPDGRALVIFAEDHPPRGYYAGPGALARLQWVSAR